MQISPMNTVSSSTSTVAAPASDFAAGCAVGRSSFPVDNKTTGQIRSHAQSVASRWRVQLDDLQITRMGNRYNAVARFCGGVSDAANAAKFF